MSTKLPKLTERVIEYAITHPELDPEILALINEQIEDSLETEMDDEGQLLEDLYLREEGPPLDSHYDELPVWDHVDLGNGGNRKLSTWSDDQ